MRVPCTSISSSHFRTRTCTLNDCHRAGRSKSRMAGFSLVLQSASQREPTTTNGRSMEVQLRLIGQDLAALIGVGIISSRGLSAPGSGRVAPQQAGACIVHLWHLVFSEFQTTPQLIVSPAGLDNLEPLGVIVATTEPWLGRYSVNAMIASCIRVPQLAHGGLKMIGQHQFFQSCPCSKRPNSISSATRLLISATSRPRAVKASSSVPDGLTVPAMVRASDVHRIGTA